jgi:hypothetical protein
VGGATRLLLERKDGSEFVAVLHEYDRPYHNGQIFQEGGFDSSPDEHGRKVYVRHGEQSLPGVVVPCLDEAGEPQISEDALEVKPVLNIERVNLAGQALTLAYLKQCPVDEAIAEITKLAMKL